MLWLDLNYLSRKDKFGCKFILKSRTEIFDLRPILAVLQDVSQKIGLRAFPENPKRISTGKDFTAKYSIGNWSETCLTNIKTANSGEEF